MKKPFLSLFISFLLGFLLAGGLFYITQKKEPQIEEKTVVVTDTVFFPLEVEKVKTVNRYIWDTIVVYNTDTVLVELPFETKQYRDTIRTDSTEIRLKAIYSGFKPTLDTIGVEYQYRPRTVVKTKKNGFRQNFSIGLQLGYGVGMESRQFEPYVGIGFQYGFGYAW